MPQLDDSNSNLIDFTNRTDLNTALQKSQDAGLYRYIFRWFPKPKQWLYIGWFGGVQIYTRKEKL